MKAATQVTVPQKRILMALSKVKTLTRLQIAAKVGYTAISGTVGRALNGNHAHDGLVKLGLVDRIEVDIYGDGSAHETHYKITKAGMAAARNIGRLPPQRDKEICKNKRYA